MPLPRSLTAASLALALAVGGVACSDDGSDTATTTDAADAADAADASSSTAAADGSTTSAADGAGTVSANDASEEEIAAALAAAGVANADRWAEEVVEYRPYDDAAEGFPHLREELAKYNPPEGTVDQIVAVLSP